MLAGMSQLQAVLGGGVTAHAAAGGAGGAADPSADGNTAGTSMAHVQSYVIVENASSGSPDPHASILRGESSPAVRTEPPLMIARRGWLTSEMLVDAYPQTEVSTAIHPLTLRV